MSEFGKKLNDFEKALKRPEQYIGSVKTFQDIKWVFDDVSSSAAMKTINYNPGLFHIVREIISNSIDNVWRSKTKDPNNPVRQIKISIDSDNGKIGVWNDGYCIPIEMTEYEYTDPKTNEVRIESAYPPEVFFGDMNSSTNYDDTEIRKTSGRNGVGAKATNVFSKYFRVDCSNPSNRRRFIQEYFENTTERCEPIIEKYPNKKGYTFISFIPDYSYFRYPTSSSHHIDSDFISLLKLYAYEVAMITKIAVKFICDGEETLIKVPNLEKFAKLYYTEGNKMISLTSEFGDDCVIVERSDVKSDEDDNVMSTTFINGICTSNGGIHLESWRDGIIVPFVRKFNSDKATKSKSKDSLKTSSRMVYPYLHFFIRCEGPNPCFDGQTKDRLVDLMDERGESVKYKIYSDKREWDLTLSNVLKRMFKWNFVKDLESKIFSKIDRSISRKEKGVLPPMGKIYSKANRAGTKDSHLCTLFITEGLSAKNLAILGISNLPKGHDYNGALAIKGKLINAKTNSLKSVNDNAVIDSIKKILGLNHGVDYSLEKNYQTLRYGKVNILTDADDDGIHIRGLILNFFYTMFPSLLERGYIESFSTAVVEAKFPKPILVNNNKTKVLRFYSNPEFKNWIETPQAQNLGSRFKVVYYKGLGSIPPRDAPSYFKDPKIVTYELDSNSRESMDIGYGKDYTSERKKLIIETFSDKIEKDFVYEGPLTISDFIFDQLIIYWKSSIRRAIPCVWDGFKESQRKVLFGILERNYTESINLEMLSGAIKEITGYHHGAASLNETIVKMAQGFVGSNNIPYLVNDGSFGTRLTGPDEHAQPRYLATHLEEVVKTILPSSDFPLLERMVEDNHKVEYKFFIPIIPMVLVNGARGMGCGFSTEIPNHNPLELVHWIERWLENDRDYIDNADPILPWYRNFTGDIHPEYVSSKIKGWRSEGILEQGNTAKDKKYWFVKELPIGLWTDDFKEWIEKLERGSTSGKKKEARALLGFDNYSTTNTVNFILKPTKDFIPDMHTKGNLSIMISRSSLGNMWLIDENDYPKKYSSAEEICEDFCLKRLEFYSKRRKYYIQVLKKDLIKAANKFKFVKGVVERKINLYKDEEDLEQTLSSDPWNLSKLSDNKKEPSFDYLLSMQMRSMTKKKVLELKNEKNKLKNEIEILKAKSPREIWKEDLDKFKTAYTKFLKTRCEELISN